MGKSQKAKKLKSKLGYFDNYIDAQQDYTPFLDPTPTGHPYVLLGVRLAVVLLAAGCVLWGVSRAI